MGARRRDCDFGAHAVQRPPLTKKQFTRQQNNNNIIIICNIRDAITNHHKCTSVIALSLVASSLLMPLDNSIRSTSVLVFAAISPVSLSKN